MVGSDRAVCAVPAIPDGIPAGYLLVAKRRALAVASLDERLTQQTLIGGPDMAASNSDRATGRRGRAGGNPRRTRSPIASTKGERGAVSQGTRRKHPKSLPDFLAILGRLSDALSVIVVAHRAIDERESDPDAAVVLAQGIAALNAIYTEIDMAESQLSRAGLAGGRSS